MPEGWSSAGPQASPPWNNLMWTPDFPCPGGVFKRAWWEGRIEDKEICKNDSGALLLVGGVRKWQDERIESRKKQISSHSRQWRVEREMKIMIFRDQERNFSFYSRFFSWDRDSRQCLPLVLMAPGKQSLLLGCFPARFKIHVLNTRGQIIPLLALPSKTTFLFLQPAPTSSGCSAELWPAEEVKARQRSSSWPFLNLPACVWGRQAADNLQWGHPLV